MSIRWRLTVWNVVLLALSLVTFASLAYFTLARSLHTEVDSCWGPELGKSSDQLRLSKAYS